MKENASGASLNTSVCYTKALTEYISEQNNQTDLLTAQLSNDTTDILTNQPFSGFNTKQKVLAKLGYVDFDSPNGIYLYPINFDSKSKILDVIKTYNKICVNNNEDEKVITYTDSVGTLMNSISTIISAITYVLIAFVGVSLVVSSIMIGIITYISVIERTKEIGVLRSIGASKRDVKHVFTAESFMIGMFSGVFGILFSLLLLIPINIVLNHFTNLGTIAMLPWLGAVILVLISVALTFIAGIIPARAASKKDPVVALRAN